MFPSCNHGNDPISYSSQQVYNGHFFNDSISTSKQDELPFSFLHLPSPFQDELEIANYDVFIQHNHDLLPPQQPLQFNDPTISETMDSMVDSNKNDVDRCLTKICTKKSHHSAEQITIRKRSSKRDRHSKINTRQGPRDRRMRLSLKVAREFFDLQDMLGFDKPSKTVEWLLVRARDDIKKLSSSGLPQMNYSCSVGTKSASSTSECEVVSGIDEAAVKGSISISKGKTSSCVTKQKKTKLSRKTGIHVLIPRESRKEARERAKKRTKEKNLSQRTNESKLCEEASNHELSQLGCYCLSPFETGEESGIQSLTMNPSMDMLVEIEAPPGSHGQVPFGTAEAMIDDSSVMTTKWSPSFILNYLYNNGMPQDNHFTELDPLNKPWEP